MKITIEKELIKLKQDLFSILNLQNVELNSKLCANYQNKKQVCHECIDSCPTDALKMVNNLPVINTSNCTNCGYCISKCDVLAFDNIKIPYNEIINQIEQYPESNITCDNASNHSKGIKVPCYLNIDLNILLQLSKYRKSIPFYLGNCSTCLKAEYESVLDHILNLQKQLSELSIPFTIQICKSKLNEENSKVINGLTRRELFQKISLKKLRNFEFDGEGDLGKGKFNNLLLKEKNLYKRRLFNKYFKNKKTDIHTKAIKKEFISIETSSVCNGCGICEKICPTEAITWNDEKDTSYLMFDTQSCIACQKCDACPENAIIFNSIPFGEYMKSENKILSTFKLVKCEECGDLFRTKDNTKFCSLCEKKQKQTSANFFK